MRKLIWVGMGLVVLGFVPTILAQEKPASSTNVTRELQYPVVKEIGGVVIRDDAIEKPLPNTRVVFDVTADSKPSEVNKGMERVARLLNLFGGHAVDRKEAKVSIVIHGEATKVLLTDEAYKSRYQVNENPNRKILAELKAQGVEVVVCGQALAYKKIGDAELEAGTPVAAAALTFLINRQAAGFAYIPVH